MKKKAAMLVLCGALSLSMLGGCGKKEEAVTPVNETESETQTEATSEVVVDEDAPEGMARSYLTGEWIDQELAGQRPITCMIENTSVCLPSYNTSQADIIYEYPVEGGITRLLAIYQDYSNLDKLGNVRSSRPYYIYTSDEYNAIYLHAGGSVQAYEILDTDFIDDLDAISDGGSYFHRTSDRKAPHNLYTSSEEIEEGIEKLGFDTTIDSSYTGHFNFAKDDEEVTLENGQDCQAVSLYLVNPKPWFEYNAEDGLYYRYEFGEAQMDGATNTQLAVKNIIIQECSISYYGDTQYLDIDVVGSGNGKYITNGKCIDITWEKTSTDDITHYYDADGNEITLNQGKTWVSITQDTYSARNLIYATLDDFNATK